jgi:hypothetical protein
MFYRNFVLFSADVEGSAAPAAAADAPAPAADAPAPAADSPAVTPTSVVEDAALGTKTAAEAPKGEADPKDPAKEAPKEPEKPAITAKDYKLDDLPEGITADDVLVQDFLEGAATAGLNNDAVNAVVKAMAPKIAERLAAPQAAFKQINEQWAKECLADPDIGGSKDKLNGSMVQIVNAMNTLGLKEGQVDQALEAFVMTGAGNNPAILRVMHKMASRLTEKSVVLGNGPVPQSASMAQRMYPSHNKAG